MIEWFGFKLHLLVDVKHEVVLSYEITDTKAGDGETLPTLLAQAEANLPEQRIESLAYDKAADSEEVHKLLSDKKIKPLIQAGKSYGKTVRVKRELDPRRFPAVPRATKKFAREYKGRTSVERVNARLKLFWGVDDGNLSGSRRFVAQAGVVLVVHAAFATLLASAPRGEGTLSKASLSPIAKALHAKVTPETLVPQAGGDRGLRG